MEFMQSLFGNLKFLRLFFYTLIKYFLILIRKIEDLIKKNKPILLITSSPGFLNYDLPIINLFKKKKIKIVSFLISWDHASGLGYIRTSADLYLVWGKNSFNDLKKYSDIDESKIKITGPLHWQYHFDHNI